MLLPPGPRRYLAPLGDPSQAARCTPGRPPTPSGPQRPAARTPIIKVEAPETASLEPRPRCRRGSRRAGGPRGPRPPHAGRPRPPRRPDGGLPGTRRPPRQQPAHRSARRSPSPHQEKPEVRPPASAARPWLQGPGLPAATPAAVLTAPRRRLPATR